MWRLIISLFGAVCCHLLIALYPLSAVHRPLLPGKEKSIQIDLSTEHKTVQNTKPAAVTKEKPDPLVFPTEQLQAPLPDAPQMLNTPNPKLLKATSRKQKTAPSKQHAPSPSRVMESTIQQEVKSSAPVTDDKTQTSEPIPAKTEYAAAQKTLVRASPLYMVNKAPPYPPLARRRGWQGTVLLEVEVLKDGFPGEIQIQTSCGHAPLDKTAVKTVRTWRFTAGMENGTPITMKVHIPIHFLLK